MLDLGAAKDINRVILKWHANAAKEFKIQTSINNADWTDVYSTSRGSSSSITDETFKTTSARYVRTLGTQRATQVGGRRDPQGGAQPNAQPGAQNGYSLYSFQVLED